MKREKLYSLIPFIIAVLGCLALGFAAATQVAKEQSGYVASMSFGIFLLIGCPIVLVFLVIGLLGLIDKDTRKLAAAFFICAVLLPASFITSVKTLSLLGYAKYNDDKMIPMGSDMPEGIQIVYQKNVTSEQLEQFGNEYFFPFEEGKGFTYESGVCLRGSSPSVQEHQAEQIRFCKDATQEQKERLKQVLKSSPLVFEFHENTDSSEIKNLQ